MYQSSNSSNKHATLRMFGYFQCPICDSSWECSYILCNAATHEAMETKFCKYCKIQCKPYRVERHICSQCATLDCFCDFTRREPHIKKQLNKKLQDCAYKTAVCSQRCRYCNAQCKTNYEVLPTCSQCIKLEWFGDSGWKKTLKHKQQHH